MELICANPVEATRLRRGPREFTYLLHTGCAEPDREIHEPFAGTRSSKHHTSGPGLSNREIEVLHLIAKGKTNKEIGCVLGISGRTVQVHASRAYDKIGVYNRAGATLWLAEHRGRLA